MSNRHSIRAVPPSPTTDVHISTWQFETSAGKLSLPIQRCPIIANTDITIQAHHNSASKTSKTRLSPWITHISPVDRQTQLYPPRPLTSSPHEAGRALLAQTKHLLLLHRCRILEICRQYFIHRLVVNCPIPITHILRNQTIHSPRSSRLHDCLSLHNRRRHNHPPRPCRHQKTQTMAATTPTPTTPPALPHWASPAESLKG